MLAVMRGQIALAPPDASDADHIVHLHGVSWADYLRVLRIRGEHSAPRITYLEGELEIMSPSRNHESIKSRIGLLVAAYCLENDIEFSPFGSWTLKRKPVERGAEPDECYVFGEHPNPKHPDLAIEVVWTSGRIDKLDVYRMLGVREVWYWRRGRLQAYGLRGTRYRALAKSKVLPGIDLDELASCIDRPTASQSIRSYRASLRKRARRT
jgi:Uma2 family endonuclease